MQVEMYVSTSKSEPYEKRMYRLSQKWLVESETWLVFLILVQLSTIYKLARMNDKRLKIANEFGLTDEQVKQIENK